MDNKLQSKIAIVTGASKGIGAAIAKDLASNGAFVIVNYSSSKEDADKVVAEIVDKGGKAVAIQGDVSQENQIVHLVKETVKIFGAIDILVNNAGIYSFAPLEETTSELYNKMFNLNVLGLLLLTKEAVKYFNPNGGSIVNISSVASLTTPAHASIYSATKAAVDAITKCLAKELGARKIRVNAVNPGMVETEGVHTGGFLNGEFRDEVNAATPLGRIGQPSDIAPLVTFLSSSEASWITGEIHYISGGYR